MERFTVPNRASPEKARMPMTPETLAEAAGELLARRASARPGPRLPPHARPADLDEAWQVQQEVTRQWLAAGQAVGGWKASLPGAGKLVAAPIFASTISRAARCPAPAIALAAQTGQLNIEPEIAFVLAHDLPPRHTAYSNAEVDAAVGSVHAALELCASRYTDPTGLPFAEMLADGLVNAGLWLGPELGAAESPAFTLSWQAGDAPAVQQAARHPDGHPRAPLYWLANFLRERGIGLAAGQVVITGSYAGVLAAALDQPLVLDYAGLARFELCFTS